MDNFRETLASNETDLLIAEETKAGTIPSGAGVIWRRMEPNSYDGFGSELSTVARRPINANRRQKKGTPVGLSASAGLEIDVTPASLQEDLQGFLFSNMRRKSEVIATAVAADGFTVANGGADYTAGTLLFAKGGKIRTNNGLFKAGPGSANGKIDVAGLTVSANEQITVSRVGIEGGAGAIAMATVGGFPALVAAGINWAGLGLTPGEMVYVGGDAAGERFAAADNNGWARVYSTDGGTVVFDKTDAAHTDDDGAGKTIRVFFGRTLRDEDAALQVARSYSLRRLLGRPDADDMARVQSEVVSGAVPSELTITIPEEDKLTAALSYIARDHQLFRDDSVLIGTVVEPVEADAINSTRDAVRARMAVYADGVSAPLPLFPIFSEFDLTINNNLSENKAVTRFGAVSVTPGTFEVSAAFTAYFSRVEGIEAVRDNADVTFDFVAVKQNQAVAVDFPLFSLSTDGAEVEADTPIMISVDAQAAGGSKYNPAMSHTVLFTFFDYVPAAAGDTV